jgi:hypothetical protein
VKETEKSDNFEKNAQAKIGQLMIPPLQILQQYEMNGAPCSKIATPKETSQPETAQPFQSTISLSRDYLQNFEPEPMSTHDDEIDEDIPAHVEGDNRAVDAQESPSMSIKMETTRHESKSVLTSNVQGPMTSRQESMPLEPRQLDMGMEKISMRSYAGSESSTDEEIEEEIPEQMVENETNTPALDAQNLDASNTLEEDDTTLIVVPEKEFYLEISEKRDLAAIVHEANGIILPNQRNMVENTIGNFPLNDSTMARVEPDEPKPEQMKEAIEEDILEAISDMQNDDIDTSADEREPASIQTDLDPKFEMLSIDRPALVSPQTSHQLDSGVKPVSNLLFSTTENIVPQSDTFSGAHSESERQFEGSNATTDAKVGDNISTNSSASNGYTFSLDAINEKLTASPVADTVLDVPARIPSSNEPDFSKSTSLSQEAEILVDDKSMSIQSDGNSKTDSEVETCTSKQCLTIEPEDQCHIMEETNDAERLQELDEDGNDLKFLSEPGVTEASRSASDTQGCKPSITDTKQELVHTPEKTMKTLVTFDPDAVDALANVILEEMLQDSLTTAQSVFNIDKTCVPAILDETMIVKKILELVPVGKLFKDSPSVHYKSVRQQPTSTEQGQAYQLFEDAINQATSMWIHGNTGKRNQKSFLQKALFSQQETFTSHMLHDRVQSVIAEWCALGDIDEAVETVLAKEIKEDEKEWEDLELEEDEVKRIITELLWDDLLADTVTSLKRCDRKSWLRHDSIPLRTM